MGQADALSLQWEGLVDQKLGKVTIAPNVLVTIVQKTADAVPGIAQLSERVPGVKRFLGLHTVGQGVEVNVLDNRVGVDIYLIAKRNVDLLQMGRKLQHEVSRAIQDIVGMDLGEINIHIEDIATELVTRQVGSEGQTG